MRALFIYFLVFICLLLVLPLVIFDYIYYVVLNKKRNYKRIYRLTNLVFATVLKLGGIKYKVVGMENIDKLDNGFLLVGNHQSYFDIPIISLAFAARGVSFISKDQILKVPIISHYMKVMNCLFLDRESVKSGMDMIKNGSKLIKEHVNLVIFPEGTRSDAGVMREFKTGSLKIATRAKSPIVPISLSKSYDLHPHTWEMHRGEVTIYIHPPVLHEDYQNMSSKELNDFVETTVKSQVIL